MDKARERAKQLFPFCGNDENAHFVVARSEMTFDSFNIFVDFVTGFSCCGVASLDLDENPSTLLVLR